MNSTSTQGLTTSQAIDMGIRLAEIEKREISDGVARAIADSFHDGSTLCLAFVSTGYVPEGAADLWQAFFPNYRSLSAQERNWADWLGTYLLHAPKATRIAGWGELWADKG